MVKTSNPRAVAGDNSVAIDALKSLVGRIERLEVEQKELATAKAEVYGEAKSAGYDVKVIRGLIAQRKAEPATLAEYLELLNTYRQAMGMEDLDL